jgi:hypothetical protein
MSKKTTVEGFDCVEMKRQIQENIDEDPFTVRLQTGATVQGGRARGSLRHDRETATRANARAIGGNLFGMA